MQGVERDQVLNRVAREQANTWPARAGAGELLLRPERELNYGAAQ